ncbi:LamG-like jellyroll fold domain-containing protein [Microbacterium sp. NIBRBAC000506063]|uniref:LamG-like jellyroll fold domain-containing protein n=1 Tax=Microbacterium sp. NIBRBAC000506063 TaxID=2734618 RepID=UPI001BB5CEF0|nr:LamG-like jellyroll fold domain-containing protein [Microbacterium sp. NIBRBAC000506063]QTV80397.1 cadherin-like domain-containing protein [Microbacterium sp. NIBRBAC000506063]
MVEERILAGGATDLPIGSWAHVAFTREGDTGTLYLNGEVVGSRDDFSIGLPDVGNQTANWLGKNGYPDDPFVGKMDEVRLYSTALDASSIARLYDDGSALRTTTTVEVSPESPSPHSEPLTVTAKVIGPGGEDAEGSVTLWVNGVSVGNAIELEAGSATFPAITRARGDHTIEVRFEAAEGFRNSTASVVHTVLRPGTGQGPAVHFPFDEGEGLTASNVGWDVDRTTASLNSANWWSQGFYGPGVNLPGGGSGTGNHILLPDNLTQDFEEEFSVSIWANPRSLPGWVSLVQLGSSTDTFFLLQSNTSAAGATGFAATLKAPGNPVQERLTLGAGNDLALNKWTHVVFTMSGSTGKIYFDGVLQATRDDFSLRIQDVGGANQQTSANMIGGTSWPDGRWNGWVDDFQLFDHELTAEEVRRMAAGPATPTAPVTNFAPAATIDHSGSASWEAPEKVNFPNTPTSSGPGAGHGWGTWGLANNGISTARQAWISYGWDKAVTLDSTDIYWLDDGAGSRVPRGNTWAIEYSNNGTSWTPVTLTNGSTYAGALEVDTFNHVEFEEVSAKFLRIRIWGVAGAGNGTGVLRWAAGGPGIASFDDRLLVRTTVGQIPFLPEALDAVYEDGTETFIEVDWQPISSGMVSAVNDQPFTVYGSNKAHSRVAEAQIYVRTNPEGGIAIDEVQSFQLRVEPGEEATLPRFAEVLYSDGSRDNRSIVVDWDFDEEIVNTPGVHIIEGTLLRPPFVNAEGKISTTLQLTVGESGSNQVPVAIGDSYTTGFGQVLTVAAPGVLGNDTDADGDTLTAVLVTEPANGELELNADGSFTYTPDAGFSGADTFTYRASDGTAESPRRR